ncbi:MAG: GNAT family N-acetyltransferase [Gemmiger sp.]|nr:GNAT family N-acetyltransferase [Gemmiger sp.]
MNATYKQVTKARYIAQVSALAEEIFVAHYRKLTPKVAAALAARYQSVDLTDEEIHAGVNYFLVYLGSEAVGYFALDLSPAGALQITRLFLKENVRGRGIGRDILAAAHKLAEGDNRSRLFLQLWAKDLKAVAFCKKRGFRLAETVPMEVLPGTTLDISTWEKLWR